MLETIIITLLIFCNGFFALAEIALVSSRTARLHDLARKGHRQAAFVLTLKEKPEMFLSAIQVGITMVGVISGMVGGLALARDFEPLFAVIIPGYAYEMSLILVVSVITYLSILFGELLPKTIALRRPEKIVVRIAPAIRLLSVMFRPAVAALAVSTTALMKVSKLNSPPESNLSDDELKMLVRQAYREGLFGEKEFELYQGFFRLIRREASQMMKHRTEMIWIDINDPYEIIHQTIVTEPYSKFVICDGSLDNVTGILSVKDYITILNRSERDIRPIIKEAVFVPLQAEASRIIDLFRERHCTIVLVVDEYGSVQGMITAQDILYQTLGVMTDIPSENEPAVIIRSDGSCFVDGQAKLDELTDVLPGLFDSRDETLFKTFAGYFYHHFGKMPKTGDFITVKQYRIEVADMDGLRIDKFLVQKI